MSTYQTDDEQVEALKKWWKEHGTSIIVGAVLGLGAVLGWQAWERYHVGKSELAADAYAEFTAVARGGDAAQAAAKGDALIANHDNSAYASFAALELARMAYEAGDAAQARTRLEWVTGHAVDPALAEVARLRLGYLLLDQGELDAARTLAGKPASKAFESRFAELRGDVAAASDDPAAAAQAYQAALDAGAENIDLVRMKLADTGHAPAS